MRLFWGRSSLLGLQLIAVAVLCCIIYAPALHQPPRADQLIYFYLNHGVDSLYRLTIGDSAFNRTVLHGDVLLFRPVLYWLLGGETWAFGYHFFFWQLTNLVLHISIASALLLLLRQVTKDGYISFGVALLFAATFAGTEMVAWQHLSGYLLFCLLLMLGLIFFHRYLEAGRPVFGYAAVVLVGLSALAYELGSVAAVLMAATTGWRRLTAARPERAGTVALCLACIPLLYAALSLCDLYLIFGTIIPPHAPNSPTATHEFTQNGMGVAQAYLFYFGHWLVTLFTPTLAEVYPGSRITSGPLQFPTSALQYANLGAAAFLLALFLLALLICIFRKRLNYASLSVVFVIFCSALAYNAILIFGRGVVRGYIQELDGNSYYAYMFALFALVITGVVLGGALGRTHIAVRLVPLVALGAIAGFAAVQTYQGQEMMFQAYSKPRILFLNRVLAAEAAAPKDHPFTFSVLPSCPNDALPWFQMRGPGPSGLPLNGPPFTLAYVLWPDAYRAAGGDVQIDCGKPK